MDERTRFVAEMTTGEMSLAEACRQAGISRKTGYKWWTRYQADGAAGLAERSHAAHQRPHAVSAPVRDAVVALRGEYPTWGPKKLVVKLAERYPEMAVPATSTVGDILARAGLVPTRPRRRHAPVRTQPLAHAVAPNAVWCADFKGDFALGDGTRCYPLTLTDAHSRMLLRCQALPTTRTECVQPLCAATFREYGLPAVIRTDNGPPFGSTGCAGLTRLSVWWVTLGIRPERIRPGTPSENGRHERMHRTLKAEACAQPGQTLREQQGQFDRFRQVYNGERPHEALGQVPPATVHTRAERRYPQDVGELSYPEADAVRWVRPNGALKWHSAEVYLTPVLTGQPVGLTQVKDGCWRLAFGPLVLGVWDARAKKVVDE